MILLWIDSKVDMYGGGLGSSGGSRRLSSNIKAQPFTKWLDLVNEPEEVVHTDLLDVNKSLLEELNRHTKAMSAIYTHHSETSSSDVNSGISTPPEEMMRGGGGGLFSDYGYDNSPIWEGENEGESKNVFMRTTFTTGANGEGDAACDERVDDVLEIERFEKSIFVRAALQLLLDRAIAMDATNRAQLEEGHQPGGGSNQSIIKVGFLKKANHHSMGTIWKTKLVELHPGLFVYEDDDSIMGKRKKSIPLLPSVCTCRSVASRKSNVFELSIRKGAKRLWLCSSEEDRQEWMRAIAEATSASASGEGALGGLYSDSPHAQDMKLYREMRESFELAANREIYQRVVEQLHQEQLCIPFGWVRGQIGEFFPMEAPSRQGGLSIPGNGDLTQLWKDMMRDKVCINGQVLYGESGPESILGALARCIVSLASKAREQEAKLGLLTPTFGSPGPITSIGSFMSIPAAISPIGGGGAAGERGGSGNNSTVAAPPLCAMTEVQAVAHTMEILLACNRTQSGGDTYYCVEYLFRNPSLVVICPYSSHAEPLQVSLELVDEIGDGGGGVAGQVGCAAAMSDDESVANSWVRPTSLGGGEVGIGGIRERAWNRVTLVRLPGAGGGGGGGNHYHRQPSKDTTSPSLVPAAVSAAGESTTLNAPTLPFSSEAISSLLSKSLPLSATSKRMGGGGGGMADVESPPILSIPNIDHYPSSNAARGGEETGPNSNFFPEKDAGHGNRASSTTRPVIRVKIQANTSYKICPLDPQDDDEDIWSIVSARFEQNFVITGTGLTKGQELVALKSVVVSKEGGGGGGGGSDGGLPSPSSFKSNQHQKHQGHNGSPSSPPAAS